MDWLFSLKHNFGRKVIGGKASPKAISGKIFTKSGCHAQGHRETGLFVSLMRHVLAFNMQRELHNLRCMAL
jgi:hypothetical protein